MTPDIEEHGNTAKVEYCPYCMSQVEGDKPCPSCGLTAGSYVAQPKHLPAGTVLRNRYMLGRVLGEGGFGITYIGRDMVLGLKVAVKEYFPTDKATRNSLVSTNVDNFLGSQSGFFERGKQRFLQEARTMAKLDRLPNIVGVRDFFEENATAYIVMEFIDGTTLSEMTKQRGGVLPAWELLHIIEPLFDSLSAMHELGLIHRDISPDNLMLEHGIIKLLDFGCAREAVDGDATMTIMLRHGYAPLEQYQSSSGAQGAWTDVYALAATIYYCITGKKPPQAMDRIFQDELIPPRKLGAELSKGQEQAILRALRVQPRERFQSAKEFHTALYEGVVSVYLTGGDEDTELSVAKGDVLKASELPVPIKKGYTFRGWYTDSACTRLLRELTVTSDIKIFSKWEKRADDDGGGDAKPKLRKNLIFKIGAAAAAVLTVLGVTLGITLGGRGEASPSASPDNEPTPKYSSTPTHKPVSTEPAGNDGGEVIAYDPDQFIAYLTDDNAYSSVVYSGDEALYLDESLNITKPVVINGESEVTSGDVQISAEVKFNDLLRMNGGVITVNGEGANLFLDRVEGDGGFIRTRNGGKLTRSSDGYIINNIILWLAESSDFAVEDGSPVPDDMVSFVFDEDMAFENAVHVTNERELMNVASGGSLIVIDSDISLSGDYHFNGPLLISENATVSGNANLFINRVLVNRGAITDATAIHVKEGDLFVNSGTIDGGTAIEFGDGEYRGDLFLVNEGSLCPQTLYVHSGCLINCGKVSADPENRLNGGCAFLLDLGSQAYNFCDFEQSVGPDQSFFSLQGNSTFCNFATAVFGSGWGSGTIINRGLMTVMGDLNNHSGVISDSTGSVATSGDGQIHGGIVCYEDGNAAAAWDTLNKDGDCRQLVRRWIENEVVPVTDAETLLAMASGSDGIQVAGDITIDGDLTVETDLAVYAGTLNVTGTLTVTGGIADISGGSVRAGGVRITDGAFLSVGSGSPMPDDDPRLELTGGGSLVIAGSSACEVYAPIRLNGGTVTVTDDSRLYDSNFITLCGGLTVTNNSMAYTLIAVEMQTGSMISVDSGGVLLSESMSTNASIVIGEAGRLITAGLDMQEPGRLTNYGSVSITASEGNISAPVENFGFMGLGGEISHDYHIDNSFINRNHGNLQFSGNLILGGSATFTNEGHVEITYGELRNQGRVVNRGSMTSVYDFELINEGTWEGNAIEE